MSVKQTARLSPVKEACGVIPRHICPAQAGDAWLAGAPAGLSELRGVTPWQNRHGAQPGRAVGTAESPNHLFKMLQLPPKLMTIHRVKRTGRGGSEQCHRQCLEVPNLAPLSPGHNPLQTPSPPQGSGWSAAPLSLYAIPLATLLRSSDAKGAKLRAGRALAPDPPSQG